MFWGATGVRAEVQLKQFPLYTSSGGHVALSVQGVATEASLPFVTLTLTEIRVYRSHSTISHLRHPLGKTRVALIQIVRHIPDTYGRHSTLNTQHATPTSGLWIEDQRSEILHVVQNHTPAFSRDRRHSTRLPIPALVTGTVITMRSVSLELVKSPALHPHLIVEPPPPKHECKYHLSLHVPDAIFIDRDEIKDQWSSDVSWSLSPDKIDIERPVRNDTESVRLSLELDSTVTSLDIPLHTRYLRPNAQGREEVILFGQGDIQDGWACNGES